MLSPFLLLASHFVITAALPRFGDFQDAMLTGQKFLYHSLLSPLINVGLLDPLAAAADEVGPALVWTSGFAAGQVDTAVDLAEHLDHRREPRRLCAMRRRQ